MRRPAAGYILRSSIAAAAAGGAALAAHSTSRAKLRRVAFWRCASASLFTNPLCTTKWSLGHRCVIGDCVVVSVFVSDRGCFRLAEVNSGQCNSMPVRTRLC